MSVSIITLPGSEAQAYLGDVARLRITVFREYPYLYEGNKTYERKYLRGYLESAESVLVLAKDGDKVVGASTGIPLSCEPVSLQMPFLEKGFDARRIYYFGESVLLPDYRGQGIGVRFFEERENWALALPQVTTAAFCGVVRPDHHPLRPSGYKPLDDFWTNRGYALAEGMLGKLSWKEINETEETEKPMQFWIKKLR